MHASFLLSSLLLTTFTTWTYAWGPVGHTLIAQLAYTHLTPRAQSTLTQLLSTASSHGTPMSLEDASIWADGVAHDASGVYAWSKPLHYISGGDEAGGRCGIFEQDCPEGRCVVGAIGNYTTRLGACPANTTEVAARVEALLFVMHFVGDVEEPLHTVKRERGGNGLKVKFDQKETNLHAVWDSSILVKHIALKYHGSSQAFFVAAKEMLKAAETTPGHALSGKVQAWTACLDGKGRQGGAGTVLECAMVWAKEANRIACELALPKYDAIATSPTVAAVSVGMQTATRRVPSQGLSKGQKRRARKRRRLAAMNRNATPTDGTSPPPPATVAHTPHPQLATTYFTETRDVVELAILKASVRLAAVLEKALSKECPTL